MKLKICGMKLNTAEVAALRPDYLGFIFWESSNRFFDDEIPELPGSIQKVGVFVDAPVEEILNKVKKYDLQAVQLHGKENPEFCYELRAKSSTRDVKSQPINVRLSSANVRSSAVETSLAVTNLKIIKVFPIKDDFDFSLLKPYEEVCDYYLFDTKGKLPGGNGYAFDWRVLKNYSSTKPYFLSGGIGLADAEAIKEFMRRPEAKNCYAIDVNSRFEIEPGLKHVERLKEFRQLLSII
ncbi:phosphoribosylanthranilate isomerase [Pricia sp.]|uniref:phosphoribosylanthranilate isomerase n=1 Tax=Pricia sp. TaxID=2268138 RepID=UPI0035935F49